MTPISNFPSIYHGFFVVFRGNKIVATLLSIVVISINTYFVINTVNEAEFTVGPLIAVGIFGVLYLLFCIYLAIHMTVSMGNSWLASMPFVQKYVMGAETDSPFNLENPVSYSRYYNDNEGFE